MIKIGTSGFSYDDWVGPVYPPGLPAREQLAFYAREFATVELNVTYYRLPDTRTVSGWVRKTPESFIFAVKAFQGLTHDRGNPEFEPFVAGLAPLIESSKLGCILAQFPYSFHPSDESRDYLARLREGFGDLPVVIELRNAGWVGEETFDLLRQLELGYCCVDEPHLRGLMPPIAVATGPVAYVRFHGRNAAKWYAHDEAWERYNYHYSEAELREWVPKIEGMAEKAETTLVYFNNHYVGQAAQGARDMQKLLFPEDV